jgi:hypothetical protein
MTPTTTMKATKDATSGEVATKRWTGAKEYI